MSSMNEQNEQNEQYRRPQHHEPDELIDVKPTVDRRQLLQGSAMLFALAMLMILGLAPRRAHAPAAEPEEASLIIVNTCAIRRHAELKALSIVGRFKAIKTARPETIIGICGCMVSQEHRCDTVPDDRRSGWSSHRRA